MATEDPRTNTAQAVNSGFMSADMEDGVLVTAITWFHRTVDLASPVTSVELYPLPGYYLGYNEGY